MTTFFPKVSRDAVGQDQEGLGPEDHEEPKEFAMGAGLEARVLAASIVPDGDGAENRRQTQNEPLDVDNWDSRRNLFLTLITKWNQNKPALHS
jgi:hypothetical protein